MGNARGWVVFLVGCAEPWDGIQIGATGTTTVGPGPGGVEVWSAGGTTGAQPIGVSAGGSVECGRAGDVLDVDLDGVVDFALTCTEAAPVGRRSVATATTETVDEGEMLVLWSGAAALGGVVQEISRRPVPSRSWVVAIPDLDGDGVDELSIASPWPTGGTQTWASVLSGTNVAAPAFELEGEGLWYPLNPTGLPMGDFDGDGVGDLVVAAWASSSADDHRVDVVSGSAVPSAPTVNDASLATWTLSADQERLFSATPVGDLDGDGVPDAVAAFEGGKVRVLFGGTGGGNMADALHLTGIVLGREGGLQVTGLGDLDGDGLHELALSVRRFNSSEDEDITMAVIPGAALPAAGSLAIDPFVNDARPDAIGGLLSCDVSGDGLADLVTGDGWYSGAALIGAATRIPLEPSGVAGGVCAGDLDGDGRSEVVVPSRHVVPDDEPESTG